MAAYLLLRRGILIFFLLGFYVCDIQAQSVKKYEFASTNGTFSPVTGTNIGVGADNNKTYANIPIGFDFWYMGQLYTSVSVSSSGWLTMGSTISGSATTGALSAGGTRPVIAPLWDNLAVFPGVLGLNPLNPGYINYTTSGAVGSRVLTVQWFAMRWDKDAATLLLVPVSVISFQAKLYENGNVQFVYRDDGGGVNNGAANIGITSAGTGTDNYLSVNSAGTAVSSSSVSIISTKPASGKTYTFDPLETQKPSSLNFTNVGATGITLNWTDNSTDEVGFVIYRSTDNVNFTYVATTAANATSYNDSGLTNAVTYYYRVHALRENLSDPVTGSQLTGCQSFVLGTSPNVGGAGNNGPVCVGATLSLSANTIVGASYSWSGPNNFSSGLQNPTLPYTSAAQGTYTVTISRNGCSTVASTVVSSVAGRWTGSVSTNWTDVGNWCNNLVPTATVNVLVPSGLTNYPIVSSAQAINNLTIQSGASVTVSSSLSIAGAITNSGTLTVSNGHMIFNGTSAQVIPVSVFAGNVIKNLTVSNTAGVTLNGALRLTGLLTASAGSFNANGYLTLASSASATAQVGSVASGASITGQVTVERYVQGGDVNLYRTYRMLSSSIYDNTATFLNNDVEGNRSAKFSQLIDNIIISGVGGSTNGFDNTPTNNAGAWTYNLGYVPIPNINTAVNAGRGMYVFYRGNRSNFTQKTNAPYVNPENTVVDFKGVLNQQAVTVNLAYSASSGFNLLGNPYASTIDWDSSNWGADKVNLSNAVWIWNPANKAYATYINGIGLLGGSRYISSGQAFFVRATAAGASIKFKENIKASAQTPPVLLMSVEKSVEMAATGESVKVYAQANSILRVGMKPLAAYGEDETVMVFSEIEGQESALHLDGELVNITTLRGSDKLAINFLPKNEQFMEIAMNVSAAATGSYLLNFNLDEYSLGGTLRLKDNFRNQTTTIVPGYIYSFDIDKSNPQTFGAGRFSVEVHPPAVLPVGLTSFTAKKQNEGVLISWTSTYETDHKLYKLYRSGEDRNYVCIADVLPKGAGNYLFLDKSPLLGNNYYKLVQIDVNGASLETQPIVVNFIVGQFNSVSVYPNPVVDRFTVQADALVAEKYKLSLYDLTGKILKTYDVAKQQLGKGHELNIPEINPGLFFIKIEEADTGKILAVNKLIKK